MDTLLTDFASGAWAVRWWILAATVAVIFGLWAEAIARATDAAAQADREQQARETAHTANTRAEWRG